MAIPRHCTDVHPPVATIKDAYDMIVRPSADWYDRVDEQRPQTCGPEDLFKWCVDMYKTATPAQRQEFDRLVQLSTFEE